MAINVLDLRLMQLWPLTITNDNQMTMIKHPQKALSKAFSLVALDLSLEILIGWTIMDCVLDSWIAL